jgi:hypothetical protein
MAVPAKHGLRQFCLRQFLILASPSALRKVAELVENGELDKVEKSIAFEYLCRREEGVPVAAGLLRNQVATEGAASLRALLQARCWREIIALQSSGDLEQKKPGELLALALAHWGEGGKMPAPLCKQVFEVLDSCEENENHAFVNSWGWEAPALLDWCLGNNAEALEFLQRGEQDAHGETEEDTFSLWRLRNVPVAQYLDDCQAWRRLFEGEPLRPAFLGPGPTSSPAEPVA